MAGGIRLGGKVGTWKSLEFREASEPVIARESAKEITARVLLLSPGHVMPRWSSLLSNGFRSPQEVSSQSPVRGANEETWLVHPAMLLFIMYQTMKPAGPPQACRYDGSAN